MRESNDTLSVVRALAGYGSHAGFVWGGLNPKLPNAPNHPCLLKLNLHQLGGGSRARAGERGNVTAGVRARTKARAKARARVRAEARARARAKAGGRARATARARVGAGARATDVARAGAKDRAGAKARAFKSDNRDKCTP